MFQPIYQLTNSMMQNLIKLEVEKNNIENQDLNLQTRNQLQLRSKALNMFHMAHIIGVDLTIKDAEKAVEGKKILTEDARGTILTNFRNILEFIRSNVIDNYIEIDLNILLHINKIILTDWKELWESKFRSGGEQIDNTLDSWQHLRNNNIESNSLQDELLRIIDWYKSHTGKVHNAIRIGVLLYYLIRTAPFVVANKLTIIALADFLMHKTGLANKTYLPVTRNLDIYEDEYLEAWNRALTSNDDITLWLERFIRNLANDMLDTKEELMKDISSEGKTGKQPFLDLNRRQLKILRYLQTIPTVKREDYVQMMDVSTMTAFRDLNLLVKKKLLRVDGKGRGTKYLLSSK